MSSPPSTVRLLTPGDAETYCALRRAALLNAPFAFAASPGHDRWSEPQAVADLLGRPGIAIVGAFERGELASIATLEREAMPKMAHRVWVIGVYTRPESRGQGLAHRVLEAAIDTARGWAGVQRVSLGVSAESPGARRVYERLGFVAWGLEPDSVRIDGRSYDEVYMSRAL